MAPGQECHIPADPDLGIRPRINSGDLLIAMVRPHEAFGSLTVSNLLLTAISVAIILSLSNDGVPPSGLIITMWLMLVDIALISPILLMARNQNGNHKFPFWTVCWPSLLWVALYAFNSWFWFR